MTQGKTSIAQHLKHETKFIDPRSGGVLREGSTPTQTVNDFRANPTTPVTEDSNLQQEVESLKSDMQEIKDLLVQNLKK